MGVQVWALSIIHIQTALRPTWSYRTVFWKCVASTLQKCCLNGRMTCGFWDTLRFSCGFRDHWDFLVASGIRHDTIKHVMATAGLDHPRLLGIAIGSPQGWHPNWMLSSMNFCLWKPLKTDPWKKSAKKNDHLPMGRKIISLAVPEIRQSWVLWFIIVPSSVL